MARVVANRCRGLDGDQLSLGTNFHWWPKPAIQASHPELISRRSYKRAVEGEAGRR